MGFSRGSCGGEHDTLFLVVTLENKHFFGSERNDTLMKSLSLSFEGGSGFFER